MNYRHGFHAGNAADVFKHVVLVWLLRTLTAKAKPLFYLESHAGAGRYDLSRFDVDNKGEYREGIDRLWTVSDAPGAVSRYLDLVRAANTKELRWYPGSPLLARELLRPGDRMVLCETASEEAQALQRSLGRDDRARVYHEDGYRVLKSMLPPPERRALILIDPSYESANEVDLALSAMRDAHTRFATGVYALWYPIKQAAVIRRLHQGMMESGIRKILCAELAVWPEDTEWRLNGSGLIIVNPPWPAMEALGEITEWLRSRLARSGGGRARVEWLVAE